MVMSNSKTVKKESISTSKNTKNSTSRIKLKKEKTSKTTKKIKITKPVLTSESKPIEQQKKVDVYVPGLDSAHVLKMKFDFITPSKEVLNRANKELGTDFQKWEELSKSDKITEHIADKYNQYINWYNYLKTHDTFTSEFELKYNDKFVIKRLGLV